MASYMSRGESRWPGATSRRLRRSPRRRGDVGHAAVEEFLQRAQAADLVDGAGDAAARADEGDLRAGTAAATPGHSPLVLTTEPPVSAGERRRPGADAFRKVYACAAAVRRRTGRPRASAIAVDLARELVDLAGQLRHLAAAGDVSATSVPRTVSSTTRPRSLRSRWNRPWRSESRDSLARGLALSPFARGSGSWPGPCAGRRA